MDPATAIQLASCAFGGAQKAFQVGKMLYEFVQNARQIDSTARDFACEVDALGSACNVVATRVQSIVHQQAQVEYDRNDPLSQSAQLWACLERQLNGCQYTINKLSDAVSSISRTPGQSSGFLDQAWRQIKLNLRASDIEEVRNRIKLHTSSLQLTLQSIAIEISYVIPNRVDQLLRTRLDELANRQSQFQSLQAQRLPEDFDGKTQETDEVYILRASQKIITSGESLYSTSQAGGSVMGDLLPGKSSYISSWMEDVNAIDRLTAASSTEFTKSQSIFSDSQHVKEAAAEDTLSSITSHDFDRPDPEEAGTDEAESDDELAIEATEMCISQGKAAFEKQDYVEANAALREALVMVRELPAARQKICDVENLRYMLGVCSFHLDKPAVAKEALLSVVNSMHNAKKQDNARLVPILEAAHMLAQLHLKLGELEQARSVCDSTLRGRRRILGTTHDSYYQSLALRVRILEIEGNSQRASTYARLLPDDRRDSLMQDFRQLQIAEAPEIAGKNSANRFEALSQRFRAEQGKIGDKADKISEANSLTTQQTVGSSALTRPTRPLRLLQTQQNRAASELDNMTGAEKPVRPAISSVHSNPERPSQGVALATVVPGAGNSSDSNLAIAKVPSSTAELDTMLPEEPDYSKALFWVCSHFWDHDRYVLIRYGRVFFFHNLKTLDECNGKDLAFCDRKSKNVIDLRDTIEINIQMKSLTGTDIRYIWIDHGAGNVCRITVPLPDRRGSLAALGRAILNNTLQTLGSPKSTEHKWAYTTRSDEIICRLNGAGVAPGNEIPINELPKVLGWKLDYANGRPSYIRAAPGA